jgi:hypothetical protein
MHFPKRRLAVALAGFNRIYWLTNIHPSGARLTYSEDIKSTYMLTFLGTWLEFELHMPALIYLNDYVVCETVAALAYVVVFDSLGSGP